MHFAHPEYFWFFLFIPLYVGIVFLRRKKKTAIQISVFEDLVTLQGFSFWKFVPILQHVLILCLITFFVVTLARPQSSYEQENISKKGIDIIIALDVSQSMLAEDLKPNRMEAAKESIQMFLDTMETDRLGIVVFSGQAFTQSPLTFDYTLVEQYLERISTESINQNVRGLNGTAIGNAILAAVNRFKKSEDRSKVLILLTDGDANTGVDPLIAAKKAAKENITVYTIGIGKDGGAPLPVSDMFGRTQYAVNPDGSLFMATFNEESLQNIAKIGNGQYFRAGDNKTFQRVLNEINALEKREIKVSVSTEYTENFMPFLVSLAFLFLLFMLSYSLQPIRV